MKTLFYYFRLNMILFGLLMIVMINGCSKEDANDIDQDEPETVLSTKSATIGSQGGTLSLDDGTSVTIAKGLLTTDYSVTLSKIGNEQIFGSVENRNCYDLSGLPAGITATLTFSCPAGKEKELIGVFNYDPVTLEGDQPAFTYDKNDGKILISNTKLRDPQVRKKRWIIEWTDGFYGGAKTVILSVPFYTQAGGSCWAADATMMAKSLYNFSGIEVEISDFLREMGLGIDDGIDGYRFMKNLPWKFIKLVPGAGAVTEAYFSNFACFKSITKKIDEGSPVLLQLSNYGHAVLAVGYKYVPGNGYKNCELIIHDSNGVFPVNAGQGTIYK
jgi:hypothetical protein